MQRSLSLTKFGLLTGAAIMLASCASRPPVESGKNNFTIVSADVVSTSNVASNLATALDDVLDNGVETGARSANVEANISVLRIGAPIRGLLYGGQNYATMNGTTTDIMSGKQIDSFTIFLADDGDEDGAEQRLANKAASILRARAAVAKLPAFGVTSAVSVAPTVTPVPEAKPQVTIALPAISTPKPAPRVVMSAAPEPIVVQAPVNIATPSAPGDDPCIIGTDGKCIEF